MTALDPLRGRQVAAVHAYRATGDREHLEVLRQDGLRQLAHALTMEGVMPEDRRGRYTAEIDAWLDRESTQINPGQE